MRLSCYSCDYKSNTSTNGSQIGVTDSSDIDVDNIGAILFRLQIYIVKDASRIELFMGD